MKKLNLLIKRIKNEDVNESIFVSRETATLGEQEYEEKQKNAQHPIEAPQKENNTGDQDQANVEIDTQFLERINSDQKIISSFLEKLEEEIKKENLDLEGYDAAVNNVQDCVELIINNLEQNPDLEQSAQLEKFISLRNKIKEMRDGIESRNVIKAQLAKDESQTWSGWLWNAGKSVAGSLFGAGKYVSSAVYQNIVDPILQTEVGMGILTCGIMYGICNISGYSIPEVLYSLFLKNGEEFGSAIGALTGAYFGSSFLSGDVKKRCHIVSRLLNSKIFGLITGAYLGSYIGNYTTNTMVDWIKQGAWYLKDFISSIPSNTVSYTWTLLTSWW